MPFYELVCIAGHYRQFSTIRDLVRSTALHVMEHGGHVRSIESWGTHNLPEKMRRHKINHYEGDYWCMQFDCSPITLASLNAQYQIDPRVIRWTNIRLSDNDRVKFIGKHPAGTIGWGSSSSPSKIASRPTTTTQTLLQEELLASVEAKMARSAALEERLATRIESGAGRSSGIMPPSMGLNAALQERRDVARAEGANIWSDISGSKPAEAMEKPSP